MSEVVVEQLHWDYFGIPALSLLGLGIFEANDIKPDEIDPRITLLESMIRNHPCLLQIGWAGIEPLIDPYYDNIEEFCAEMRSGANSFCSNVGFLAGFSLSLTEKWSCCLTDFQPALPTPLWESLLLYEAFALYIADSDEQLRMGIEMLQHPEDVVMRDEQLLQQEQYNYTPQFNPYWLSRMTSLFPVVVSPSMDGLALDCYSQDETQFAKIYPDILTAIKSLRHLHWYSTHRQQLVWSDKGNALILQK